jgi:putative CRISPR-associated protein (TIGR02619 family)
MKPDALLCTVGTSIFTRMPDLRTVPPDRAAGRLRTLLVPSEGGAEYETLHYHCRSGELIDPRALYLFCSDTDDGEAAARILEAAFRAEFFHTGITRCKGLRDDDPRAFATRGLRSLVNGLVRSIQQLRNNGFVPAIDATGGYKPQIAHAVLVGQVMQVPVFYRYQGFPEVIKLPPLPVSVDPQVWFDHLWFFDRLREEPLADREIPRGDERIAPLLEREEGLAVLSPLGELMAAAADQLLASGGRELLPVPCPDPPDRKKIIYEDGNAGRHSGLAEFCKRIRELPFVTRIASFYFNPDLPLRTCVRLPRDPRCLPDRLEVWYGDGSAVTKLYVWTTARGNLELAAARAEMCRLLGATT